MADAAWHGKRMLNRRWHDLARQLPEAQNERGGLTDAGAVDLMLAHPTLLKRPLLDAEGETLRVGFDEAAWARALEP